MRSTFVVQQMAQGDAFLHDYHSLRLRLWPECREDCDREITEILTDPDRWAVFIVLREGQVAVGFLEVHLREYAEGASHSPVAFVEGWFLLAEHRRQGLGRALMQAAESWAICRGCHELGSDTPLSNDVSIEAHGRLGFQEVERLVCFLKQLPG